AAAEVLRLARARAARLWHPGVAAKPVECLGVLPDPAEWVVTHVLELQCGDPARCMAGPDFARRRDRHVRTCPAAHAGLGELLVVVGKDPHDLERGAKTGALTFHHLPGRRELGLGRHERATVVERPAV